MSDASSDVFNNPADIAQLIATARAWMLDDPDPETAAEIAALVDRAQAVPVEAVHAQAVPVQAAPDESNDPADALDVLRSRFAGRLAFGTAGLRGKIGAGQSLMNSKVVVQTSAGFAQFLMQRAAASASSRTLPEAPSVVVGFDARTKSRQFAFDTAQVLSGAGLSVTLLDGPVPTPVVAFAVRHLNASAGVMITASHNPPQDNGYKVYLGDADAGSQIASPVDAQIAALIDDAACLPLAEIPRDGFVEVDAAATRGVLDGFVAAAVAGVAAASGEISSKSRASQMYTSGALGNALKLKIVYTAMHGVGFELTKRVFAAAGLPELMSVPEQEHPDGTFPTVNYPNPEEPGALDLAIALAEREHADLIIAHDPDADRLAVALPSRSCATNGHQMRDGNGKGFTQLTGNELGLLLGWECAERASNQPVMDGRPAALAATIVSSPALGAVAAAYGLSFVQTLSGFKWVSRVPNLIFGFEEALGYLVNPAVVRDKDGISAAALLTDIAARLQADGKTLWHRLDEASERFGHFASDQITVRLSSSDEAEAMSAGIRSHLPTAFGEVAVERFTDFSNSTHHFGGMPVATNLLRFDLEDGSRVMIRPSGTEPKLKVYLDANCLEGTVSERRANAEARVGALRSATEELIVGLLNQLIPLP